MSLLHICCNYAYSRVYVQLFERLAAAGLRQQVYVPEKRAYAMGENLPEDGAFPVRYSLIVKPWDAALYHSKARRAAPDVARHIDLSCVKLIHAHTLFTDGGIAYRLHQAYGIPYVVSLRMTDLSYFFRYRPDLRAHGLRILRAARRVTLLSPAARETLLNRYVPTALRAEIAAKCEMIPNGIDAAWLEGAAPRAWRPGEPLRIAFAGKLEPNKQPLRALEAALALQALLPDSPVSLHMAGEGPLEAALRAHSAARSGALVPRGYVSGIAALRAFYDDCHLFLLPSLHETFGLVYLEAMSRGLPVLYTRGQGFDGHFAEGEVGYSVDATDTSDIARAACRALADYAPRSARCIERAGSMTWAHAAERMAAFYRAAQEGTP